jgi:hypothetical protein
MLIALVTATRARSASDPGEARAPAEAECPGELTGEGLHLFAQEIDAAQVVALLGFGEILVELAQPLAIRVPAWSSSISSATEATLRRRERSGVAAAAERRRLLRRRRSRRARAHGTAPRDVAAGERCR